MDHIQIPPANELHYSAQELRDARDFLDDNCVLVSPTTLAAAAALLKEVY